MKPLSLGWISEKIDGIASKFFDENIVIDSVCFNSKMVKAGSLFFALVGERDGHEFVEDAIRNSAAAVVVGHEMDIQIPQIIVADTLFALGELARNYRQLFDVKIIGITGSVGKTTTREMIKRVLSEEFKIISSPSNFNNLIGLPMTLFELDDDIEIAVCEMGINQPGEMSRLCEIAEPDIGLITRIAPVHLELLGTLENIAREKLMLFERVVKNGGVNFYSLDDQLLDMMAEPFHGYRSTFGVKSDADFYADHITITPDAFTSFKVDGNLINLKIPGIHNVYNALGAYAVGRKFDIPGDKIAESLSSYISFEKRMERIEKDGIVYLDDTYNANPVSMKAGVSTLISMEVERRIVVFGDMLELGVDEIEYHQKVIEYTLSAGIDVIVLTGKRFKAALDLIENDLSNEDRERVEFYKTNTEINTRLKNLLKSGDVILVKGSHKMMMDRIRREILDKIGKKDA